jgi:hypothetical protein
MVEETRAGLFVSYSRADAQWRDRFLKALMSRVPESDIFVDRDSIRPGVDWREAIAADIRHAKCALLLLTDHYLKIDGTARKMELPLLLEAEQHGLKILPVLVEPCAWKTIPALSELQFMSWPGDVQMEAGREVQRSLSQVPADSVQDAVVAICAGVAAVLQDGAADKAITRDFTDDERADIPRQLAAVFENRSFALTSDPQPIHTGEFALVYGGRLDDEQVAVKAIPTTALRKRVSRALSIADEARTKLRDTSFVHVEQVIESAEIQAVVMEYVEWPTLYQRLTDHQEVLGPLDIARLLSNVARAQAEAHKRGVPLGALSPLSIFVDDDREVRLSPFRIEAHLARGLTLGDDQIVSGDVLEMLTPEIYEGRAPVGRQQMDAHGQYYLGLLGLELLLGCRPIQITCLRDLRAKEDFFTDPRAHFESRGANRWTDEAPALAFVLARLLARQPIERLASADVAAEELAKVADGNLPDVLRRCLEDDYDAMMRTDHGFSIRFYERLFSTRPSLKSMFDRSPVDQSAHLIQAIQDLVEFHRGERWSRFLDHARMHAGMGITAEDADAFRWAFVAEVVSTCRQSGSDASAQLHGDAWNAVLRLGIDEMFECWSDVAAAVEPR